VDGFLTFIHKRHDHDLIAELISCPPVELVSRFHALFVFLIVTSLQLNTNIEKKRKCYLFKQIAPLFGFRTYCTSDNAKKKKQFEK